MSKVSVAILAGGQSRRMGTDKSFVSLHGKPLFEHVLSRVSKLNLPLMLITNSPEKFAHYEIPMYQDILPNRGSLGGIYSAVEISKTEFTLCLACDMPFLSVTLLKHLIELCTAEWDIVTPRIGDYPEAMHSLYRKTCLTPIQAQLEQGRLKASGFFNQVRVRYVDEPDIKRFDPDLRSFMNLNTPDEVAKASQLSPD